jgi:hypothetical protein
LFKEFMMIRKIAVALALTALTGVASASVPECREVLWLSFCDTGHTDIVVKAPEIDPASAMAGLTLLAGGLAVLRGRKTKNAGKK